MGRQQVICHGDDSRFELVAGFIAKWFTEHRYVADVAGGQGLLSRLLTKKYGFEAEVIDPRGHVLKGVAHQAKFFSSGDANFYDLIVGLHPDGAIRAVVEASVSRPTVLVPCCNFWSDGRMGLKDMLADIRRWFDAHGVKHETVDFGFKGPYRLGLVTTPP